MLSMSKGRQADTDGQTLNFIFSFYVWLWKRSPNSHENVNTELPSDSKCKRFRPWAGVKDKVNFENERGRERLMPRTIRVHFIKCCSFLFRNSWSVPIKLLSNEFSGRLIELPGTTSNMCQAKVYQWFDICPTKKIKPTPFLTQHSSVICTQIAAPHHNKCVLSLWFSHQNDSYVQRFQAVYCYSWSAPHICEQQVYHQVWISSISFILFYFQMAMVRSI